MTNQKRFVKLAGIVIICIAVLAAVCIFTVGFIVVIPNIACLTNHPGKINVLSNNIWADGGTNGSKFGGVALSNITDGKITNIKCTGSGAFAETVECPNSIEAEKTFMAEVTAGTPGKYEKSTIQMDFIDNVGNFQTVKIDCIGSITIS